MKEAKEKHNYKVSDEDFLAIPRENNCLFAQTAKAIEQKYNITYRRQAAEQRAKKYQKEIEEYRKEISDFTVGAIYEAAKQDKDMKLKFRAAIHITNKLGKIKAMIPRPKKRKNNHEIITCLVKFLFL
jgi:hypothetical protein